MGKSRIVTGTGRLANLVKLNRFLGLLRMLSAIMFDAVPMGGGRSAYYYSYCQCSLLIVSWK